MPQFKVQHYNDVSGMLHSEHTVFADDENAAVTAADELVKQETGHGEYALTGAAYAQFPSFRTAVTEVE